jgi:hypothetical protein
VKGGAKGTRTPDLFHAMVARERRRRAGALIECRVVQALPPPFSPGAPPFAPHASNSDRGDPEPPSLSLGKPVNPLVRWCFQAEKWHLRARLVAFLEGSALEGSSS